MPKLVRLYITHVLIGFALSAVFVGALFALNVANLWHLVSSSPAGLLAAFMLWFANGIVFSGVQFGIVIMRMGEEDGGGGGKRQKVRRKGAPVAPMAQLQPVKVAGDRSERSDAFAPEA